MTSGTWDLGCKVNWTLEVLGRRADGFHELRSWFLWLDGGDQLGWEPGPTQLSVTGPDAAGVPADPRNLVLRADTAWREAGGIAPSLAWTLAKRLPAGSGLGAGSADAAGVLRILECSASQPLGQGRCLQIAAALGSDVPFFLGQASAQLLGGRGEILLGEQQITDQTVVLAIPQAMAATPAVFAAFCAPDWNEGAREAIPFPSQPQGNQLEEPAVQVVPELAKIREALRSLAPFQLSGSGAAWFCPQPASQAHALAEAVRALGLRAQVHRCWSGYPAEVQS